MIRMLIGRMRLLLLLLVADALLLLLPLVFAVPSNAFVVVVVPSSSDTTARRRGTFRRTRRSTRTWLYDDDDEKKNTPPQLFSSSASSSTTTSPSSPLPLLNAIDLRLLQAALQLDSGSSKLIPVRYAGEAQLPSPICTNKNIIKDDDQQSSKNVTCAVVVEAPDDDDDRNRSSPQQPGLVLPLSEQSRILLPKNEYEEGWKNIFSSSRLELWRQNLVFVLNRDDGIYDNLPYTKWWIDDDDKQKQQRDAANNLLNAKYHMGKRELYNLMLGKDWYRTEWLPVPSSSSSDGGVDASSSTTQDDDAAASALAARIRQVQQQELQMLLAECESQLAIQKQQQQEGDATTLLTYPNRLQEQKLVLTEQLEQLLESSSSSSSGRSSNNNDINVDEEEDRSSSRVLSPEAFTNSYELLRAIVNMYMGADFFAVVLENSSLLEDGITCGGALILKRKVETETMTVLGEQLQVPKEPDGDDDINDDDAVLGGELYVVECSFDEALSISESCAVPLYAENDLWQSGAVMVEKEDDDESSKTTAWKTLDPELSILVQGQSKAQAPTERTAPIRLERTLLNDFADDDDSTTDTGDIKSNKRSRNMFPQDNLVTSLAQFDAFDNDDKARMLLSMSNTRYLLLDKGQQQLPRPRTVRQDPNILNEWLLPLVDESVRKQYLIRQAMEQQQGDDGNFDDGNNNSLVQDLMNTKSKRQIALEKAEMATDKAVKDYWTNEAQFYESLRADITQDVGSYSRFLDRDEWYERTRQIQAKKLKDKSKFGTLLDGIE